MMRMLMNTPLFVLMLLTLPALAQDPIEAGPSIITDSVAEPTSDVTQVYQEGRFTFKANSIDLHTALALFAQSAGLTLRSEAPLVGNRNIDFSSLTINQAIETILAPDTIPWSIKENALIVGARSEPSIKEKFKGIEIEGDNTYRIITIDYPQTLRSSKNSAGGSVNGLNGRAAEVTVSSEEKSEFWAEVKLAIEALMTEKGKYSINYITGVIFIEDKGHTLNLIQKYLVKIVSILTRQVKITARIYEVDLKDENTLGIDWSFLSTKNLGSLDKGSGVGTSSVLRDGYKPATISANLGFVDNFRFIVEGLSEQGELRSVSQPRITTIHNQPAIVKVGTQYPYFTTFVQIDPVSGERTINETVEIISLGTWLSITPQISKDSNITLTVDPVLTDLAGSVVSAQGATAPIVDIKQSSSILRVRNLETVRISGLQQTKETGIKRKVPFLGDVPYIGPLFTWENTIKQRKELVIFITTEIVD